MLTRRHLSLIFFTCFISLYPIYAQENRPAKQNRKKRETLSGKFENFTKQTQEALKKNDYVEMESVCRNALNEFPESPLWMYNLACALARQEKTKDALRALEKAVITGFRNTAHMEKDPDLDNIRKTPDFQRIMKKASKLLRNIPPSDIKNGIAYVTYENLVVDKKSGLFKVVFNFPEKPGSDIPVVRESKADQTADGINEWFKEGTAAGNHGDLYDNRDGYHSNLRYGNYPQLARVKYSLDLKAQGFDKAMSAWIYYNANVVGNASMAGARSLPRTAQISQLIVLQYLQYINNHIFVYPEHRDHDNPKGDTFPANTPYCLISQGSSGSDQPFLNAVVRTFAAFMPETKEFLSKNKLLAPTLQMIFRSTLNRINTVEGSENTGKPVDYLTGEAHPTVFTGNMINELRMVTMAHEMRPEYAPPMIQMKVVTEDRPVRGKDYFDVHQDQVLFDTPCAIARVMRSKDYMFRIVVSAEKSFDVNQRKLTFRWEVLRGDRDRIVINPQNSAGSVVELLIPYHTRGSIPSRMEIESNRVDIGVFANNGKYWSAPGFVTAFFLDHETRKYDEKNNIVSIDYNAVKNRYVDATVSAKKNWKDVYDYAENGRLLGWKRFRGDAAQEFTPEGGLLQTRDGRRRPLSAKKVNYKLSINNQQTSSTLQQEETDEIMYYWYKDDSDLTGEVLTEEEYNRRKKGQ